jgi:hypothetical protein
VVFQGLFKALSKIKLWVAPNSKFKKELENNENVKFSLLLNKIIQIKVCMASLSAKARG